VPGSRSTSTHENTDTHLYITTWSGV
jgi:hypothetical protein